MKRSILFILIATMVYSCKNPKSSAVVAADKKEANSIHGFDLSDITFKESINQVMKETGLKLEDGKSPLFTLVGRYKAFESANSVILKFNGVDLTGKTRDSVNKVIFHYSVKDSTIGLIELKLFTEPQVMALTKALDEKLGKAPFPADAYTRVFSKNIRYYERTWVDPKTTIAHFLTVSMNEQDHQEARMAVLNYSNKEMSELTSLKSYTPNVQFFVDKVNAVLKDKNKN